jgi:hypothetical protein
MREMIYAVKNLGFVKTIHMQTKGENTPKMRGGTNSSFGS